jgi:predicted Na+-dependent transporter
LTISNNAPATATGVAINTFSPGTSDISILFVQVAQGNSADVVVNLV